MNQLELKPGESLEVVGRLEDVADGTVHGWAFCVNGEPLELQLRVAGVVSEAVVSRHERADVTERYGEAAQMSGFVITSPGLVVDGCANARERIEVVCNGGRLKWVRDDSDGQAAAKDKEPGGQEKADLVGAYLDSVKDFAIKGWALRSDGNGCTIKVVVNETVLDCAVVSVDRHDVGKVFNVDASNAGFDVLLPGSMWEHMDESGMCEVKVYADNESVNPEPLLLGGDDIEDWLLRILREEVRGDNEFIGLLALEHVKHSGVYERLQSDAKDCVAGLIEKFQLEDYLPIPDKLGKNAEPHGDSVSLIVLRDAMLELNALLDGAEGEIFPLICKVYRKYALKGTAKEWYLNLAVQLTCGSDEFERLGELTDFQYLDGLHSSQQPHQLALLLPVLVTNGEVGRAAEVLRHIAKYIENSWLPSDCLAYAVRHLRKLEQERSVDIVAAEKFRAAFIHVLDGFKGAWFSRHHDRVLVSTMVSLLADVGLYTDYHKREVIKAALRHYGLSPVFWQLKAEFRDPGLETDLAYAQGAWSAIVRFMDAPSAANHGAMMEACEALEYFKSIGNSDASIFLTELAIELNAEAEGPARAGEIIRQRLVSNDIADDLRLAAHPVSRLGEDSVESTLPSVGMPGVLRGLGDYHKSAVYEVQYGASQMLVSMWQSLLSADESGRSNLARALTNELDKKCTVLGTWQGMFLGVDLMLSAYQIGGAAGYRPTSLLMNAVEMIRKAVNECGDNHSLPAPICAAIGRIAVLVDDRDLKCFLGEVRDMVKARYGSRYDDLFDSWCDSDRIVRGRLSHDDALVVVDTTRERIQVYGDTIRQTWAKELESRGIACLFVVGGESVSRQGDVLELDVPESHERKTQKALRLYDWVIKNTNAQYVIKVGDNAFIDVGRYFDSLSYRKYHYYGKIIKCATGKFDRQWHKRMVGKWAQGNLDKSPANSCFVTSKLSCSLSRAAIVEVLQAAGTWKGKYLQVLTYSDDKLVGDLLAMRNIFPSDEDFDAYTCGAGFHEMVPGEVQGGAFLPGRMSSVKVAYCGAGRSMQEVSEKRRSGEIWPKTIWPTYQRPSLKPNANQLELLTGSEDVRRLLVEELVVVSVVRNEMVMLPQFLEHYRSLGVKCFIFVDNCSDDGTREYLLAQPDTVLYSAHTEYRCSHYGVAWQQAVLGNHCLGKWALLADADEFLVFENSEKVTLSSFVGDVEASGGNGVLLYMIDMYPYGDLSEADFTKDKVFDVAPFFDKESLIELRFGGGMYSNSRNYVNGLRHRIAPSRINAYVSQKYALFKYYPWIRLCEGVHYSANMKVSPVKGFFAHFKYHSGFKSKVELEVKRKQHFNGAEEYKKYAGMIAEMSGGFGVDGVSEKYVDSRSFVRMAKRLKLQ